MLHTEIYRISMSPGLHWTYISTYIWWSTDPLMTLQPLSPRQEAGVPGAGHPAHLHPHLPSRVRAVHGRTGQRNNSHPRPPLAAPPGEWVNECMQSRGPFLFYISLIVWIMSAKAFYEWPLSGECVTTRFHPHLWMLKMRRCVLTSNHNTVFSLSPLRL